MKAVDVCLIFKLIKKNVFFSVTPLSFYEKKSASLSISTNSLSQTHSDPPCLSLRLYLCQSVLKCALCSFLDLKDDPGQVLHFISIGAEAEAGGGGVWEGLWEEDNLEALSAILRTLPRRGGEDN